MFAHDQSSMTANGWLHPARSNWGNQFTMQSRGVTVCCHVFAYGLSLLFHALDTFGAVTTGWPSGYLSRTNLSLAMGPCHKGLWIHGTHTSLRDQQSVTAQHSTAKHGGLALHKLSNDLDKKLLKFPNKSSCYTDINNKETMERKEQFQTTMWAWNVDGMQDT